MLLLLQSPLSSRALGKRIRCNSGKSRKPLKPVGQQDKEWMYLKWCQHYDKDVPHTCLPPLNNNNLASIPVYPCLGGYCGIQHHMTRDLEGVLPTCASGNRHIDLGPGCRPCSRLWTGSSLSQQLSRSPGKHSLRQSLMDETAFMEVQVSIREGPAWHWSKQIQVWMHWRE